MRAGILCAVAVLAVGCGGAGGRDIVSGRDLPGGTGTPDIERVIDLGELGPLPAKGPMPRPDSDGDFVVGELVLIEGDDFSKLPTVTIGGRPTETIARTGNGGIICRIPPEIPTGQVKVEVSHPGGKGSFDLDVRRYGLVVQPDTNTLYFFEAGPTGVATPKGTIDIPGARDVAFSADGAAAYVSADAVGGEPAGIAIVTMPSGGGPHMIRRMALDGPTAPVIRHAARAPIAAIVHGRKLSLLDTRVARTPSIYTTIDLPGPAGSVAVDPEGRAAAALLPAGNQLVPIDLAKPALARAGGSVGLLPDEKVPLLIDGHFAPDGRELWVVAGDNRESVVAGARPTRLIIVKVDRRADATVSRNVEVSGAAAPLALAVARRESIGAAAAIRSDRRRAAIVLAAINRVFIQPREGVPLNELGEIGQLVRTDLDGQAQVLATARSVFSDADISHDLEWVATATTRVGGQSGESDPEFGVSVVPLAGGKQTFVRLGKATTQGLFVEGSVALAP